MRPLGGPLDSAQLVIAGRQIVHADRLDLPRLTSPDLTANAASAMGRGAWMASLDSVREDLGDWTVSSAFVEHGAYAGSTAGPCTISLLPPGSAAR